MIRLPGGFVLAPGRFHLLLLALLLFFLGTGAGGTYRGAINVALLVLVIGAAVWDVRDGGRGGRMALALAGGAILLNVVDLSVRIRHLPVLASSIVALFAGLVVWQAYVGVMRPHRPAKTRIVGAVCVYLLIGLAWAKLYETLDAVVPGSFRFPANSAWETAGLSRYTYVSFITLATVGYGDVTPGTPLAGTLAWLEAVTGQLYLAITVARLVALSLTDARDPDTISRDAGR